MGLPTLLFPYLDLPAGFPKGSGDREIKWHRHALAMESSTRPNNGLFPQSAEYVHFVELSIRDIMPRDSADLRDVQTPVGPLRVSPHGAAVHLAV